MEKIKNLTPHPIRIILPDGDIVFQPEGLVRLKAEVGVVGRVGEIPLTRTVFGEPEGLPKKETGVLLIVSQIVKNALPDRDDLVSPGEVVRDEDGNIVGCKSLTW